MKEYASIVIAVFALLIPTPTSARADSFTTFTVMGTYPDNTTLSGTFTLDTTTGAIAGFDLVTANDAFTPANSTGDVELFTVNTFKFLFENDAGGSHSLHLVVNGSCSPIPSSGRCVPVGFNVGNLIPQTIISQNSRSAVTQVSHEETMPNAWVCFMYADMGQTRVVQIQPMRRNISAEASQELFGMLSAFHREELMIPA